MQVEYVGETLRPVLANVRERTRYNSVVGNGTYIFKTDEEKVIDATESGNIAQLINHSCEPNCFSRVVTCGQEARVVIAALRDIKAGEELTYDYRFSGEELLACCCGSRSCRKIVNSLDTGP